MNKHAISIMWSEEDKGYIASIPGIPTLSAFGNTRDEALSQLHIAAQAYFEALEDAGQPQPQPGTISTYSGQLRLRMPRGLHAALSDEAEWEGVSLNTYLVSLLSERHSAKILMNKINNLEIVFDKEKSSFVQGYGDTPKRAHGIDEAVKKYRKKES